MQVCGPNALVELLAQKLCQLKELAGYFRCNLGMPNPIRQAGQFPKAAIKAPKRVAYLLPQGFQSARRLCCLAIAFRMYGVIQVLHLNVGQGDHLMNSLAYCLQITREDSTIGESDLFGALGRCGVE